MKKLVISLTLLSLVACSHPASFQNAQELRNPEGLSHQYQYKDTKEEDYLNFKNKILSFSSKISQEIASMEYDIDKNLALSPFSIALCLGLVVPVSQGQTKQEVLAAFDIDEVTFNKYYKLLFNEMLFTTYDENQKLMGTLDLTNSIWLDNDYTFFDSGLDKLRDDYYTYSYEADFANKNTNDDIAKFIKEKTRGLINPNLNFNPRTAFVLMNTLYLKDIWNLMGDDLPYTKEDYHFVNANKSVSSKKLLEGYYAYGQTLHQDSYSSFYTKTEHGLSLYFIKPNEGHDILDVFNKDNIEYATNISHYKIKDDELNELYFTRCLFPEFKGECDVELKELMKSKFNINQLFSLADMSLLIKENVFCDSIRHIAKLDVNKKGIEGAAVTMMAFAGAVGPVDIKEVYDDFVVDGPFGYVLMKNNTILFSGITNNID